MSVGAVDKGEAWDLTALGELGTLIRGVTYKKAQARDSPADGYLPLLRATNIGAVLSFDEPIYIPTSVVKPDQMLVVGDVVIAMSSGSLRVVGKSAPLLDDWEGTFGAFCAVFRPGPTLIPEFISKILSAPSYRSRISKLAAGANINNLTRDHLLTMDIPVPPLDEQRRIVATLDEALGEISELKRNRQAKIEAFDDVKASMLSKLLQPNQGAAVSEGWATARLGELCSLQNGYAFKSKEYSESGAFLMRIGNVQDGFLTLDKPAFVSLDQDGLERFALNAGDMLVSLTGNIGRVGEVKAEHLPAALNQRVCRITVRATSLEQGFLFYFLRSTQFRDHLGKAGHGAAQQNVSMSEIAEVQIPLPPLDEQRRIVATLDKAALAADSGKAAATEELELADAMASSLMTELLTAA